MVCLEKNFKSSASPVDKIVVKLYVIKSNDSDIDDDTVLLVCEIIFSDWDIVEDMDDERLFTILNDWDIDEDTDDEKWFTMSNDWDIDEDIDDERLFTMSNDWDNDEDIDDDTTLIAVKTSFDVVNKASLPILGWAVQK